MSDWPDNFDFETDAVCQSVFKPFIEEQLAELKAFDQKRIEYCARNMPSSYKVTYQFHKHARRVAEDLKAVALHIGLGEKVANNLYWAMLPHDIGKMSMRVDAWDMIEKPDDLIKSLRRSHTALGLKRLDDHFGDQYADHPFMILVRDIMLHHHEQMDGDGTLGLDAGELSLPVRLASIVESYDGWQIKRPHFGKRDVSVEGVIKRMRDEKLHMFDPELFEAFAEMKISAKN